MKKYYFVLLAAALVCGVQSAAAAGRVTEILQGLSSHVRSLGNYSVAFSVDAGGNTSSGSYAVGGDSYYLHMGDAEVYSDGKARYEVNNRTREVTIDAVDTKSRNILNNPTRAFDLAGSEFTPELLWERNGQAAVKLTPKASQGAMSAVTVTVDTRRMEPLSLIYDFDGDRISIAVQRMAAEKTAPKAFDRTAYKDYELIDFR